jgi:hypothetical protein
MECELTVTIAMKSTAREEVIKTHGIDMMRYANPNSQRCMM